MTPIVAPREAAGDRGEPNKTLVSLSNNIASNEDFTEKAPNNTFIVEDTIINRH